MSTITPSEVSPSRELARRARVASDEADSRGWPGLGLAFISLAAMLDHVSEAASRPTGHDLEQIAATIVDPAPVASVDLDKLRHPVFGGVEWRYGGEVGPRGSWPAGPAVSAAKHPDVDGYTATIQQQGWTRDELPGLIAFLSAVYAASTTDPQPADDEAGEAV